MKIAILLFATLIPAIAAADVYNCKGKWTNEPCEGGEKAFEEKEYIPPSPEELKQRADQKLQREKSFLIADFRRQAEWIREVRGIYSYESKAAIAFCEQPKTALDECAKQLSAVDKQLSAWVGKQDEKDIAVERLQTE